MQCVPEYAGADFFGKVVLTKTFAVECTVPEGETVKTPLCADCSIMPESEEIISGGVNVSGRAAFYLAYEAQDGKLRKTECGAEFSVKAESDVRIEKVAFISYYPGETTVSEIENGERKICSEVTLLIECLTVTDCRMLSGGDGLLVKKEKLSVQSLVGTGETHENAEEEFRVNYRVADILMRTECAVVTEAQCGLNSVIADGNVFLRLLLLQNGEKNAIITEERKIPFRAEVEIDGVTPEMTATAVVCGVRSNLKAVVDEDKNYTDITANFDIIVKACAVKSEEKEFVSDAYSPLCEVEIVKKTVDSCVINGTFEVSEKVFLGSGFSPENNEELVSVCFGRIENASIEDGTFSGILSAYAITRGESGYYAVPVNSAFSFPVSAEIKDKTNFRLVKVCAENFSFRQRAEVELEAIISLQFERYAQESFNVIAGVNVGEEKQAETSAISVYVGRAGDTAWDVCKRLGENEDTLNSFNPSLAYPLKGGERIIVYRGL